MNTADPPGGKDSYSRALSEVKRGSHCRRSPPLARNRFSEIVQTDFDDVIASRDRIDLLVLETDYGAPADNANGSRFGSRGTHLIFTELCGFEIVWCWEAVRDDG
jgi:hypothetical protein